MKLIPLIFLVMVLGIPLYSQPDRDDKLILSMLNQINIKMDRVITDISDQNSRISRIEEWRTIRENEVLTIRGVIDRLEGDMRFQKGGLAVCGLLYAGGLVWYEVRKNKGAQ